MVIGVSEIEFLERLRQQFPASGHVEVGIGDDGAILNSVGTKQVVVTDMLLDEVHFDLKETTPQLAARKALTVNISDLAAMGCRPMSAFLSLAIPRELVSTVFVDELYDGIQATSKAYDFCIAGGDTNVWDQPFAINVTLIGEPYGPRCLLRSGASAGDIVAVTGPLGGSLFSGRHLTFEPRLDVAAWASHSDCVTAMMDISDGLAIDLNRMMAASNTGVFVNESQVPIHDNVPANAPNRLYPALSDGEDFELLLALSKWPDSLPQGVELIEIGEVKKASEGLFLIHSNGSRTDFVPNGFAHF